MGAPQRIVSLLPSTTEMVFALGLGDRLVGISHECDFPLGVREGRPVLTAPKVDAGALSAEIDRQVRALVASGLSVYRIDEEKLRELRPDLVLTQDACAVCAVSFEEVREATCRLIGNDVQIVSLKPLTLDDVLGDVVRVGRAAGVPGRAEEVVQGLQERLERLRQTTQALLRPRTLALEWMDPPMPVGHWTPELLRIAGAEPVLGRDGAPTGAVPWERVRDAAPEALVVVPCGFKLPQTLRDLPALLARPELRDSQAVRGGRVFAVDGNAYFNRPGPRLVDSAELIARALHTAAFQDPSPFGPDALWAAGMAAA